MASIFPSSFDASEVEGLEIFPVKLEPKERRGEGGSNMKTSVPDETANAAFQPRAFLQEPCINDVP